MLNGLVFVVSDMFVIALLSQSRHLSFHRGRPWLPWWLCLNPGQFAPGLVGGGKALPGGLWLVCQPVCMLVSQVLVSTWECPLRLTLPSPRRCHGATFVPGLLCRSVGSMESAPSPTCWHCGLQLWERHPYIPVPAIWPSVSATPLCSWSRHADDSEVLWDHRTSGGWCLTCCLSAHL